MRTAISLLVAALASSVFLTSVVLETGKSSAPPARRSRRRADVVPGDSRSLLGPRDGKGVGLLADGRPALGSPQARELLERAWRASRNGADGEAVEILRQVISLEPENRLALEGLGVLTFRLGDFAAAETALDKYLTLEPGADPVWRMQLGVAQMRQGRFAQATDSLRLVLAAAPDDGAVHFALACSLASLGEKPQAIEHLRRAHAQLGSSLLAHISDALLDSLRDSPEFLDLVQKMRAQHVAGGTDPLGASTPEASAP